MLLLWIFWKAQGLELGGLAVTSACFLCVVYLALILSAAEIYAAGHTRSHQALKKVTRPLL